MSGVNKVVSSVILQCGSMFVFNNNQLYEMETE